MNIFCELFGYRNLKIFFLKTFLRDFDLLYAMVANVIWTTNAS